jgi:threonine/homoserine/homoserine lactone efflux protein
MGVTELVQYFVSGILLGFAAGVSPGPLLALVIAETLMHGKKEGVLVSLAPALTDLPIIVATVFFLSRISGSNFVLGIISLSGAFFVGYLAYKNITIRDIKSHIRPVKPQSIRKGVITNFLSPHPYLFWMTIGAPTVLKASQISLFSAALFMAGFYLLLIGSKILIALTVERSKNFLQGRTYLYVIRTTGVILMFFAGLFFKDGLVMLRLI